MAPPFDSVDVIIGSVVSRLEKDETDINELHTKQREAATKLDQLFLHADDIKNRVRVLEAHDQNIFDSHHDVSKRVEMMESKVDDMRSNLSRVLEGQMQILNSNIATREEFNNVLTTQAVQHTEKIKAQSSQHLEKMKRLRHIIYLGGAVLVIAIQWWASHTGQQTLIDSVLKFVMGGGL